MLKSELITIGKISAAFGIKGWIKIHSFTDSKKNILNYLPWIIKKDDEFKKIKIIHSKQQGNNIIVSIEGITDRDIATTFCGCKILINKNQLPKTKEGEYYWTDIIGLYVKTKFDVNLGKVSYLIETGANNVLVVKNNKTEILIPFLPEQVIKKIDFFNKIIIVDWDFDF